MSLTLTLSQNFNSPPGWTDCGIHIDWGDTEIGPDLTSTYGLGPGKPILEHEDGLTQISEAGNKFYLWIMTVDDVYEIDCRDIHDLYDRLWRGGMKTIETRRLEEPDDSVY